MTDSLDFTAGGRVLSEAERAQVTKHKGRYTTCGIQVTIKSKTGLRRERITDENVWNGICIRCNKTAIPKDVLEKWNNLHKPMSSQSVH